MTHNDFHAAMYQANLLYGVSFANPDEFEEIALIAYSMIGNKNTRLYRYKAKISEDDLSVELPCNCDILEAVTYNWEDWNYTTGYNPNGDIHSAFTEQYIESRKAFDDPLYIKGKFADYQRIGNKLYFDKNYGTVNILYKGQVLDGDGLPELNDKEVQAIAAYCAYVIKYREGIATNNANLIQVANTLKQEWFRYCSQAQVPEEISQNEMNNILDVKTQWMRKVHNKSYKPIM